MNKIQAEALRAKIVKRQNVLKELDFPLSYSKSQLHGGMYGRNVRRQDRDYMRNIRKQRTAMNKNIKTVDNYLTDLNTYSNIPAPVEGEIGVTSAPMAPIAPNIKLSKIPTVGRRVRRGIGSF